MKVLLVRTKPYNLFAKLGLVCFEPLELEYLAAVVNELQVEYKIYDGMIDNTAFTDVLSSYQPDVVAITGYSVYVNSIKSYADTVKKLFPKAVVIVGGAHAELNAQDFYSSNIDIVVYANPLAAFKKILYCLITKGELSQVNNICINKDGAWIKTHSEPFNPDELPFPDRTHLNTHSNKFRYFGREKCALVKTAWGCCYNCNFCYCAHLNGGKYSVRQLEKVIEEISSLKQEKIFIVDDDFLTDRARVIEFCRLIKEEKIIKNFSVYGRADNICANSDILPIMKMAGIEEIIVGLEACDDMELEAYNKQVTRDINFQALEHLRKNNIHSCALFIVNQSYEVKDFRRLSKMVKLLDPDLCMFSIFTPLKGIPEYEKYREQLIVKEDKYEYLDFLHSVIKPSKMSIKRFYYEFYRLYFSTYLSKRRIKNSLLAMIKSITQIS